MKVKQTLNFSSIKKKLHPNQINELDQKIQEIIENPNIGIQKKGDLNAIRVYKFKLVSQLYLLAYQVIDETIILQALGSHQNFYRDLKRTIP